MRKRSRLLLGYVFVFFFLANPAYFLACEEEDRFTFGEEEMVGLLGTVNDGEWTVDTYRIEFTLDQQSEAAVARFRRPTPELLATAQACGTRTFVKSAEACEDLTEMPVVGTATIYRAVGDGSFEQIDELSAEGDMEVGGLNLSNAFIELSLPDGNASLYWNYNTDNRFVLSGFAASDVGGDAVTIDYSL